ncbi:hypothetical protein RI129_011515 [Pyrocoelia pectoralis]|uniref:SUI1 domain-containing protein n=1 Tax=Pyrocoelia pectoralis TaxID=417401 RepID=A0AAN7ZH28_9COLE
MFVKPFKIRLFNQLNKSHCKQFREKCVSSFPRITDPNFSKDFITKKDMITLCKITTHNNQLVDVYVVNQVPLFFTYNGQLFPTIYFLWKYPDCLLYFTTYSGVVDKLKGGADLMLPGVVYPKFNMDLPEAMSMFERNTRVYVNVTTNKAAIAVGVTAESTTVLNSQRNRGKCVIIYHSIDDYLCKINEMQPLPQPELGIPVAFPVLPPELLQTIVEPEGHSTDNKESSATDEVIEGKMMDDLMLRCLLVAMKYAKDLKTPVLLSTFCNTYMKRACPAVNIAKSTYGKLTPFMLKCVEDGLIELEKKGSVYMITKFNTTHEMVETFTHSAEQVPKIAVETDTPIIIINQIWFITQPVFPLCEPYGFKLGNHLTEGLVEDVLKGYIKIHNLLITDNDTELIKMTPYLKTLIPKQSGTMNFDTFRTSVLQQMTKGYELCVGDEEIIKKGELLPINISTAKRSNKCVTLITNVEAYNINMFTLARECQSGKGIGVKVNQGPGSSTCNQLQLQGNQVTFIYNLLIKKYGVPEKWVVIQAQPRK